MKKGKFLAANFRPFWGKDILRLPDKAGIYLQEMPEGQRNMLLKVYIPRLYLLAQ
jgi:hypothetical protein